MATSYQQIRRAIQSPRAEVLPRDVVAEVIDGCRPQWPLAWPYPGDYREVAIGKILRRFRDPVLAIRATLWALRMALAWMWQRDVLTAPQFEAWNNFIELVENEEPFPEFPEGYRRYLGNLTRRVPSIMVPHPPPLRGLDLFLTDTLGVFTLMRAVRRLNRPNSIYRVLDEEDYYFLGNGILHLLEETRYEPLSLSSESSAIWARVVPRWWEILQCVMPIRDILGPPLTFAEIEESEDEFSWGQEVLQALVGPLTEILHHHLSALNYHAPVHDFAQETWSGRAPGGPRFGMPVVIHANLPAWVEPPRHVEIKVEMLRDEEALEMLRDEEALEMRFMDRDFFLEEWFDFPIETTIEEAAQQIGSAIGEAVRR